MVIRHQHCSLEGWGPSPPEGGAVSSIRMVSDARSCASAVEAYRAERRAFAEQTDYLSKSTTVSLLMEHACFCRG